VLLIGAIPGAVAAEDEAFHRMPGLSVDGRAFDDDAEISRFAPARRPYPLKSRTTSCGEYRVPDTLYHIPRTHVAAPDKRRTPSALPQ
jgi:hypothetical protein